MTIEKLLPVPYVSGTSGMCGMYSTTVVPIFQFLPGILIMSHNIVSLFILVKPDVESMSFTFGHTSVDYFDKEEFEIYFCGHVNIIYPRISRCTKYSNRAP